MTVAIALVIIGSTVEFGLGMAVGRRLPRRGRHSRPRRPWAQRRWDAVTRARSTHPTAYDDNVVIDLRAWVPDDGPYDPAALRSALGGR